MATTTGRTIVLQGRRSGSRGMAVAVFVRTRWCSCHWEEGGCWKLTFSQTPTAMVTAHPSPNLPRIP
eukprot:1715940-Amphidinium_carterae.1